MDELSSDAATWLAQYHHRGKPGRIPGTRELIPHESYRLVYQIDGNTAWILTLVHTARQWPPVRDQERIIATMKQLADRLLSSQTVVGGCRPSRDVDAAKNRPARTSANRSETRHSVLFADAPVLARAAVGGTWRGRPVWLLHRTDGKIAPNGCFALFVRHQRGIAQPSR